MFALRVNRSRHEHKTSASNKWGGLCCYAQKSSLHRTTCRPACLEMEHSGGYWMGSTAATFWIMQVLKSFSVLSSTLLMLRGGSQNLCQCMNINWFKNKDVQIVSLFFLPWQSVIDGNLADCLRPCCFQTLHCNNAVEYTTRVEVLQYNALMICGCNCF